MNRLNFSDHPAIPIGIVSASLIAGLVTGHGWVGLGASLVTLIFWRTWWSCVYGFGITMWCIGGALISTIPYLLALRDWISAISRAVPND